jgi:hypothetical protein
LKNAWLVSIKRYQGEKKIRAILVGASLDDAPMA